MWITIIIIASIITIVFIIIITIISIIAMMERARPADGRSHAHTSLIPRPCRSFRPRQPLTFAPRPRRRPHDHSKQETLLLPTTTIYYYYLLLHHTTLKNHTHPSHLDGT